MSIIPQLLEAHLVVREQGIPFCTYPGCGRFFTDPIHTDREVWRKKELQQKETNRQVHELDRNHHTLSNLARALETYRERNRTYGDNYRQFGKIMASLFPNGMELKTAEDFDWLGIVVQIVSKLSRYSIGNSRHMDTIHDAGVYCFMLEELDAQHHGFDTSKPKEEKDGN